MTAPRLVIDWWKKREIEKMLTAQLHEAHEAFRLANIRLNDMVDMAGSGIPAPDSNLAISQAHRECERTFQRWSNAIDRLKRFIVKGTIPEDL